MRLVFDIEADGLLGETWRPHRGKSEPPPVATKVHCISVRDVDNGQAQTYSDTLGLTYDYPGIQYALATLSKADILIGHNIIRYDLPMLKKFYGWEPSSHTVIHDTMVMSHLGYTALYDKDKRIRNPEMPQDLWGKHSLRAWGHRIGCHKGHVNDTQDFSVCDEEMLRYCERDVEVNAEVYRVMMESWGKDQMKALDMEHRFFWHLERMMEAGWYVDTDHTRELVITLQRKKEELENGLMDLFPAVVVPAEREAGPIETNRWWNPKQLKTKEKTYPFNPSSSAQVIWNLWKKYGWEPKSFTEKGNPILNDEVIASLEYPEARALSEYAVVTKRLASLVGPSGYLTLLGEDGRLHGNIEHCGAVSHRCTHQRPNIANATGNSAPYGREIRQCFSVPEGYRLVGGDASALELCMLAHRMAPFDGGSYCDTVVNGDPHTRNWQAAELDSFIPRETDEDDAVYHKRIRNQYGKRMIYALMYGAGDKKLGSIIEGTKGKQAKAGKSLKAKLFKGLPALKKLISSLKDGFHPGQRIEGLDGRIAENRSAHQALNTQLQMDGAIVMKWATVLVCDEADKRWEWGKDKDWCMVGHIHDEFQFQVREGIANEFAELLPWGIQEAGRQLSVLCRLDGDAAIGDTWADTH